jgi:hypothetical protein
MIVKCSCQKCGGHLEFESTNGGQIVCCPHCGMETQLSISKPRPRLKALLAGTFLTLFLILVIIGFVIHQIQKRKADLIESQNRIIAAAAEKAEADKINAQTATQNYLQQYSKDNNFPSNERSFEVDESDTFVIRKDGYSDEYKSKIRREYKISYINQDCILVERNVFVDPQGSETLAFGDEEMRQLVNYEDNISHRDWDGDTEFRILRKEDNVFKWIETYKNWRQISLAEHLTNGITKNISKCCTGQAGPWGITEEDFKDVNFVTPNNLIIGYGQWSDIEIIRLEKLLSMIPDLDEDLKAILANKAKEENDLVNQNQLRVDEEKKAETLLK